MTRDFVISHALWSFRQKCLKGEEGKEERAVGEPPKSRQVLRLRSNIFRTPKFHRPVELFADQEPNKRLIIRHYYDLQPSLVSTGRGLSAQRVGEKGDGAAVAQIGRGVERLGIQSA
ncbi:uncharacterized protein LOC112463515, partial [Temnothorax curvispinosus]|uniref:Uncharacterized protein LOC112463515 n=1 Tax=Temnothorax curvispinosus TaxID=300111 RepID=A0A6J1QV14_9HYME